MPKLTFHHQPGDSRYSVRVDGVRAGWAMRGLLDGRWSFHACVTPGFTGRTMASGYLTRAEAVMEGLSTIRCMWGGGVYSGDDLSIIPGASIEAIREAWFRKHYPVPSDVAS